MSGGKMVLIILGILVLLGCVTAGIVILVKSSNRILGYSLIAGGAVVGGFLIALPIMMGGKAKAVPKNFQTRYEMAGGSPAPMPVMPVGPAAGMRCTTCGQPMPPGTSTCPRCSPGGGKRPIAKTRVYGEAAPTGVSEGWLQVIHGVDRGLKIQFTQAGLSIGRGSNNVFVINDPGSSTNHAQLVNKDGSLLLLDLGSANGTYVNEQRVTTPIPLSYGDIIRINHTRIQVLDPQFQAPPKPA